jgi:hypothetical protein
MFMYSKEGIEFGMVSRVGVLLLFDDIRILNTCESRIVDVCNSSSISCVSTMELVVAVVVREEDMFFKITRLSISFIFILIIVS